MVSDSIPPSSARRIAVFRMRLRLSLAIDKTYAVSMKAIVHERYGRPDVLELREVDVPVPEDDQVLVRVQASSVNPVEWYGVTGPYFARIGSGLRRPRDTTVGGD